MKKNILRLLFVFPLLFACGNSTNSEKKTAIDTLKEKITAKENSFATLQDAKKEISTIERNELIDMLLDFYTRYPKDAYAPVCLDKVHMVYSAMGLYNRSSEYADILLEKYPKYVNRAMILSSQASNYDIFIQPRDTNKIKYYNTLLLKENPKMDKEMKADIEMKLKHLDLNLEEYLHFVMKQSSGK